MSRPHNERRSDPLFVAPVAEAVILPNTLIWMALDDPDVSDADFAALVRSIHGETGEDI